MVCHLLMRLPLLIEKPLSIWDLFPSFFILHVFIVNKTRKNSSSSVGIKSFFALNASEIISEMFDCGICSPSNFTSPVLSHVIRLVSVSVSLKGL